MMVKSYEILKGERWWHIEYVSLHGEKCRISSFTSKESAENYIKVEGIRKVDNDNGK
jgi:hypothetical protein